MLCEKCNQEASKLQRVTWTDLEPISYTFVQKSAIWCVRCITQNIMKISVTRVENLQEGRKNY